MYLKLLNSNDSDKEKFPLEYIDEIKTKKISICSLVEGNKILGYIVYSRHIQRTYKKYDLYKIKKNTNNSASEIKDFYCKNRKIFFILFSFILSENTATFIPDDIFLKFNNLIDVFSNYTLNIKDYKKYKVLYFDRILLKQENVGIKDEIDRIIYGNLKLNISIPELMKEIGLNYSPIRLEKEKEYIFKALKDKNLSSLKQFDKVRIIFEYKKTYSKYWFASHYFKKDFKENGYKISNKFLLSERLKKNNYVSNKDYELLKNKYACYKEGDRSIYYYSILEFEVDYDKDSFSTYRFMFKRIHQILKNQNNKTINTYILNDNGSKININGIKTNEFNVHKIIPLNERYLFKTYMLNNNFAYNLKKIIYTAKTNESYPKFRTIKYSDTTYDKEIINYGYYLKKNCSEKVVLKVIENIALANKDNLRNNEFNQIRFLLSNKKFFTKSSFEKMTLFSSKEENHFYFEFFKTYFINFFKESETESYYEEKTLKIYFKRHFLNRVLNSEISIKNGFFNLYLDLILNVHIKRLEDDKVKRAIRRFLKSKKLEKYFMSQVKIINECLRKPEYIIEDLNFIKKIIENKDYEIILTKATELVPNNMYDFYKIIRIFENNSLNIKKYTEKMSEKLSETKSKYSFQIELHDVLFSVSEIIENPFLTKSSVKKLLEEDFNIDYIKSLYKELPKIDNLFKQDISNDLVNELVTVRLNKGIEQKVEPNIIIKSIVNQIGKEILKNYGFKETTVTTDFFNRINKYVPDFTVTQFFTLFGKNAMDILSNKLEGIFEETVFISNNYKLANIVKDSIGTLKIKGKVKNNRKLFGKLNKVKPIKSILSGNFNYNEAIEIINILENFGVKIPKETIGESLFWGKVEKKSNPEYLIAGDATNCCMGINTRKLETYLFEKGFGIFNVYYEDRIVANSVIWLNKNINEEYELILDNIEVKSSALKNNKFIKIVYGNMINYMKNKFQVKNVYQGSNYNDLILNENNTKVIELNFNPVSVSDSNFYTDARFVYEVDIS